MCVCVCVCVCVCECVHCVCVCVHCVSACVRECVRECVSESVRVCVCVCSSTPIDRVESHRLRFSVAKNQRLRPFCVDPTEDECHVLFVCPVYSQLRDMFPLLSYRDLLEK